MAATLVVATALAVAGLALLGVLRADLRETARAQAAADAKQLAAAIAAGVAPGEVVRLQPLAVVVVDLQGRVLASSAGEPAGLVPGTVVEVPSAATALPASSAPTGAGERVPDAAPSRPRAAAAAPMMPVSGSGVAKASTKVNGRPAVVFAAVSGATESSALAVTHKAMLIGLPMLLAVVAAVTWLVTRRALLP